MGQAPFEPLGKEEEIRPTGKGPVLADLPFQWGRWANESKQQPNREDPYNW